MGGLEASSLVNKVESSDIITSSDSFLSTEEKNHHSTYWCSLFSPFDSNSSTMPTW